MKKAYTRLGDSSASWTSFSYEKRKLRKSFTTDLYSVYYTKIN